MQDGNGHKVPTGDNKIQEKQCPFLKAECLQGGCALWSMLNRNVGGLQQTFGACSISAMVLILSEINQKAAPGMAQPVKLPGGFLFGGKHA